MAFKKAKQSNGGFKNIANKFNPAISIKKGVVVEGWLVSHRIIKSKEKGKRDSILFTLRQKDGSNLDVWGNGYINNQFLEGNGKRLNPSYKNYLVRLTGKGLGKKEKGKNPAQITEVLVDQTKPLRGK